MCVDHRTVGSVKLNRLVTDFGPGSSTMVIHAVSSIPSQMKNNLSLTAKVFHIFMILGSSKLRCMHSFFWMI